MIKELFNLTLEKMGYISKDEAMLRTLSKPRQKRARHIIRKLETFRTAANVNECYDLSLELSTIFKDAAQHDFKTGIRKKDALSLVSMSDLYGYKPANSRLYNLFSQNPFGCFAFIGRHHPVVRACLNVIMDEIAHDGFVLISEKGTTKKRLKEVYRKNKRS